MRKFLLGFASALLLLSSTAYAQERTVSGKVSSAEDGSALPGVNVVIKGTTAGTVTDAEGNFKLSVPSGGGSLVFSFIGLQSQEVAIGDRVVVDVSLSLDVTQLSELVVTALGIKREVKTLSYAAQSVSAEQLNITRANNVSSALAGKVAGIQVRGSSGANLGANSSIRIRGAGSLTDKEPLYVLDGTPVASEDLNPDDIENISVLKGPTATAMYGQRGDAGVILLTSKKGNKNSGLGVTVSQNTFFENVYVLPKYQNSYAGGASSDLIQFNYKAGMPTEWQSLDGAFYHDYTDDASWGPRMVGQQYIPWYAWAPGTKYTGKTTALVEQPSNIRDFYETGVNNITNVSLSQANDNGSVRISYTHQGQTGTMPNTSLKKNTLAVQTSYNFGKFITAGANFNYVNTLRLGEFDEDYSNQTTGSFNQWFHRNLDMDIMQELQNLRSPEGRLVSWNHFNPDNYLTSGDKFYRGYYWHNHTAYLNQVDLRNNRDRLFGDVNLTFNLAKNFKVAAFYRKNQSTITFEDKRPSILPFSFYTENRPTSQPQWDYYGTGQTTQSEDNLEVLAMYNTKLLNDKFSIDITGGGNIRKDKYSTVEGNTFDGLVVPDLFTLSNSRKQPFSSFNYRQKKEVRSLYASGNFGYNETFFVTWSVRNDWSSALPVNNNSYLYPSIGSSFVFSELTESALPFLSLGKLRASWAQVGSDLDPYQLQQLYAVGLDQWGGNITTGVPNELVDANISPSLSSSYELGVDLKFFQNRIGLSTTYYKEVKKDEILSVGITGTSGSTSKKINAGQLERSGIEIQLDANVLRTTDFSWDIMVNLARQNSKIVELSDDITFVAATALSRIGGTQVAIGDAFSNGQVFHAVGEDWGQIRGITTQKINGQPVIDANGLFVPTDAPVYHGSVLPDFTGGILNTINYKAFVLNFNIDFQKGGQAFSLSDFYGSFSGLTEKTAGLNDKGNPVRDNPADGGGVHVVGVSADGTRVDTYVDAQEYYHQFNASSIIDQSIFGLGYIKLREISLGYRIPVQKIGSISKVLKSATFSLTGRDLWLIQSDAQDFDPSQITDVFGENGGFPGTRSYGFSLKVGF
jgi:TonB-linked SusC/RagA family outer membrane protein